MAFREKEGLWWPGLKVTISMLLDYHCTGSAVNCLLFCLPSSTPVANTSLILFPLNFEIVDVSWVQALYTANFHVHFSQIISKFYIM